jgi:hypothetical protein
MLPEQAGQTLTGFCERYGCAGDAHWHTFLAFHSDDASNRKRLINLTKFTPKTPRAFHFPFLEGAATVRVCLRMAWPAADKRAGGLLLY